MSFNANQWYLQGLKKIVAGDTTPPSTITGLVETSNSDVDGDGINDYVFQWNAATDNVAVTQHRLEISVNSVVKEIIIINSALTVYKLFTNNDKVAWAVSKGWGSGSYCFRVSAGDAATPTNWGLWSNQICQTITVADVTAPTFPTQLYKVSSTETSISLAWASADNIGVTSQVLYWRILGGSYATIALTAGQTSYTKTGLVAGTTYEFFIRASDAASNTADSYNLAAATSAQSGVAFNLTQTGGTVVTTCNYSNYITRYHNKIGSTYPSDGYYVYTDAAMTTPFNGGNLYYTSDNGTTFRIASDGFITTTLVGNCL